VPILGRVKRCPNCGYIVPAAWTECRQCAAPLALGGSPAPPPPAPVLVAPRPAPADDALLPGRPRVNGHAVDGPVPGPDTWLPKLDPSRLEPEPAPAPPRFSHQTIGIAVFVLLFAVAVGYAVTHRGHHESTEPTILAAREPFIGIPTSLTDAVRIEAESSRHTALSVIVSAASPNGTALGTAQLEGLQPGYRWIAGDQPSTTNTEISVSSVPGADTIAVSATNKDICAFGRWTPAGGAVYVTMAHVPRCTATAAPATGWSTVAGGAAQDLPNELGD
jgi:hypothetical protein